MKLFLILLAAGCLFAAADYWPHETAIIYFMSSGYCIGIAASLLRNRIEGEA